MAYRSSRVRSRGAPEFITAYTVSEVESPATWSETQGIEDDFSVEELVIEPPSRRPGYHGSGVRGPPPPPSGYHHEERMFTSRGHIRENIYEHDRRTEWNIRQRHYSPQLTNSSSACSGSDCEECAYAESRRAYTTHNRIQPTKPVPYVVVPPRNGVSPRRISPLHDGVRRRRYADETPRVYRLHDSTEFDYAPPPTREHSLADNGSIDSNTHNQVVLYQGTTGSTGTGGQAHSDGMSMIHSNVSSPRWSIAGQHYLSGSDTQSDAQPHSPMTSFEGLYEYPDPRFAHHVHPPPRMSARGPVVITRSNEGYGLRPGGHDGYGDTSGSDGSYSNSEGSFSSDDREYRPRDYERRYW